MGEQGSASHCETGRGHPPDASRTRFVARHRRCSWPVSFGCRQDLASSSSTRRVTRRSESVREDYRPGVRGQVTGFRASLAGMGHEGGGRPPGEAKGCLAQQDLDGYRSLFAEDFVFIAGGQTSWLSLTVTRKRRTGVQRSVNAIFIIEIRDGLATWGANAERAVHNRRSGRGVKSVPR